MQKQLSRKQMYKGVIFEVTQDQVQIENGMVVTRDIVHHHGGVGIIAVINEQILLVKQYRYATQSYLLEIPAGKLERNEDSYACGLRELEEETGYTSEHMEFVTAFYSTPGFCNEKLYIYQATQLSKVEHPLTMDEDECIDVLLIPIQQAYEMVQQQRIIDAKTIIAIQHVYIQYLQKNR